MLARRYPWLVLASVLVVFVVLLAKPERGSPALDRPRVSRCPDVRVGLAWYRARANEWRWRLGVRPIPLPPPPRSCASAARLAARARARSRGLRREYERWFSETYAKWRCVHSLEGAWTSNTGNGYRGGLQFDDTFAASYGPEYVRRWGGAHRWPVWAQLRAAERAYRTRGWTPWPNTARDCGLL